MLEIIQKQYCCGCFACTNKCPNASIKMLENNEGFVQPRIDRTFCNNCGLCNDVCPLEGHIFTALPSVYACKNINKEVRGESSSGGVFTLLAEHILSNNGIVFGAMFDANFNVNHGYVENKNELYKLRGSKYVQSLIGDTYQVAEEFLKQKKLVLFSGTPCQIAGLNSYLNMEYENLFTVDLVCHGVPSPKVYRKYLDSLKKQHKSEIKNMTFRDKQNGWKQYNLKIEFVNSYQFLQNNASNTYLRGFLNGIFLRSSCYHCQFKGNKSGSDITLGDYWGVQTKFPDFDDNKGVSLVLLNSVKGRDIFLKVSTKMDVIESDFEHAMQYNPSLIKAVMPHPKREKFFEEINKMDIDKLIQKYCTENLVTRVKYKFRNIASRFRVKIHDSFSKYREM